MKAKDTKKSDKIVDRKHDPLYNAHLRELDNKKKSKKKT